MYEHSSGFPAWKHPVDGLGAGHTLLTLKDDLELKFVADVVADALLGLSARVNAEAAGLKPMAPPRTALVYIVQRDMEDVPLLGLICQGLGVAEPRLTANEGFQLSDGRTMTVFNANAPGWGPADEEMVRSASAESLVFVVGAEKLRGPPPELALEMWRNAEERKKNGKWPYLCRFEVGTYALKFTYLGTKLSPRWWTMNSAYAALKEARSIRRVSREDGARAV